MRCETLELENSDTENELDELQANANALFSLKEEVDRYGRPSILASQIEKLKSSLAGGEKCYKFSEYAGEACRAFEADRKDLQQIKDYRANALKVLEDEVVVARWKSRESLQQTIEVASRVCDEMLEQAQMFCPDLSITTD